MKATELLEKQHRKVEALFKKLETGRGDKAPVLAELATSLAAHMQIEQDIFYPAVRAVDPDLVNEAFEEHALGEIALRRLCATAPEDDAFHARVVATKELIEHHVKEEEDELFPQVEKKLDEATLNELGKQMKVQFEAVVAAGFEATVPRAIPRTTSDAALRHL